MKAIKCNNYGGAKNLELVEIEKPEIKPNEILIKIKASSVTTADTMMITGKPYIGRLFLGLTKPKHPILGTGFAGIVEAMGSEVTRFKVGDEVFGESIKKFGCYAEYINLPEDGLIELKPANVQFDQLATVGDGIMTSINLLRNVSKIKPGQHVLINGAAGSLGSAAVQLAVQYGAKVTGVCSTRNVDFVKSLGAHNVIDYTQEDFTKNKNAYDIVYDTVGKSNFKAAKQCLKKDGVYSSPVLGKRLLLDMLKTSFFGNKKARFSATGALPVKDLKGILETAKQFLEANKIKPFVEKKFSLSEFNEAYQHIASGHKRGNIVFEM